MNPAILIFILLFLPLLILLTRKTSKRLPPGSLGLPVIGQTLSFLRAMRDNTTEKWLQDRITKYGHISKFSFLGTPTVFLHGQAANKFIYTCDSNLIANQQPDPVRRICGERNIMELSGDDHKRVRGALVSFLKPEVLKQYVGKIDEEIRHHFQMHWHGKEKVLAMPLMKTLTFNVISKLIIGIEQGKQRDKLVDLFQDMIAGVLSMPINLPFTQFNQSLKASAKMRTMVMDVIREKRASLEQQKTSAQRDLISCLLTLKNKDSSSVLSDEEIIDNIVLIMIAGYDTTSILLTFLIRLLANDSSVYASILQEQEQIAKSKASGELPTWEDLGRMKLTWRVAMETLRMTPPVLTFFRKVLKDFEYEGYLIPKGWQVIWAACMTQMDERIFPDASKFDPARFENPAPVLPYSFVAFGGGPRICPGYEFAKIETLVAMHYLVTKFTWKLCNPEISFSRDPLPTFRDGLEIEIKPRSPCCNVN